jgi:hypothetical protein
MIKKQLGLHEQLYFPPACVLDMAVKCLQDFVMFNAAMHCIDAYKPS